MKNRILLLIFSFSLSTFCSAQFTKKEEKMFSKSVKMYHKKKYKKAIELIEPVVNNHVYNPILWKNKIEYCYQDYQANGLTGFGGLNFTISTEGDDEMSEETQKLMDMMNAFLSMSIEKRTLRFALREATRYSDDMSLERSYIYLRALFIDPLYPVDTSITTKAKEYFRMAEASFRAHDYNDAAEWYKKAMDEDPSFYKASLYRGDSYFALKEYARAAPIFGETAEKFPNLSNLKNTMLMP